MEFTLTEQQIKDFVSYIDLNDIREFVEQHPELFKTKKVFKNLIFDNLLLKTKILKAKHFDFIIWKGAKQDD